MPTYEYRCENGHTFEVMQRMSDDPIASCQTCAAPVQRVFHPIAVHFKGSGFYNTDYGTRKRAREQDKEGAGKHDAKTADAKADKPKQVAGAASESSGSSGSSGKADSGSGSSAKSSSGSGSAGKSGSGGSD
jgi:putative FmdB family regulatory protein